MCIRHNSWLRAAAPCFVARERRIPHPAPWCVACVLVGFDVIPFPVGWVTHTRRFVFGRFLLFLCVQYRANHQATPAHTDAMWTVAWGGKEDTLVTGSVDETVKLWCVHCRSTWVASVCGLLGAPLFFCRSLGGFREAGPSKRLVWES